MGRGHGWRSGAAATATPTTTCLRDVWRAQNALESLEIEPDERVALIVNDEPAFVAWFLGGLRSGVVPVPLSTMLTGDELAAIVADAGAAAVVTSDDHSDRIPS